MSLVDSELAMKGGGVIRLHYESGPGDIESTFLIPVSMGEKIIKQIQECIAEYRGGA